MTETKPIIQLVPGKYPGQHLDIHGPCIVLYNGMKWNLSGHDSMVAVGLVLADDTRRKTRRRGHRHKLRMPPPEMDM